MLEMPAVVTAMAALTDGGVIVTFADYPPMIVRERAGRMYAVSILQENGNVSID